MFQPRLSSVWRSNVRRLLALAAAVAWAPAAWAQDPGPSIQAQPRFAVPGGPTAIVHAGDGSGRIFVATQQGRIYVAQGTTVLSTPFLDVSSIISSGGERGLLGLAFHPRYDQNGFFFIDYTDPAGNIAVARYKVSASDPNQADPSSAVVVLTVDHPVNANHNGGNIAFGPDGYLYIATGDGGAGGDPPNNAQNLGVLLGKLLRIDVSTAASGAPYQIPPTNPFNSVSGARGEIWDYGLRNPFRFSFDRQTRDLIIADVGQNAFEEVDFEPAGSGGRNYGWRKMEGFACYNPSTSCNDGTLTLPVLAYSHNPPPGTWGGCSITGGYRYRGQLYPELQDVYFYADYCNGNIWGAVSVGGAWTTYQALDTTANITTFGEDESGELFFGDLATGTVYQILPYPSPVTRVVWTRPVGVTVEYNHLTKTTGTGWNAGAASTVALTGDGYLEFVADGFSDRVIGLGYADSGASFNDIAFGLNLSNGGNVWLAEASQLTNTYLGTYMVGDRFDILQQSGVVSYYRNGQLLYTSSGVPLLPLWVESSIYHPGGKLASAAVSGSWEQRDPAVWRNAVGVTVSRNNLMKTGGTGWNAGASSNRALARGNGFVEFVASGYTDRVVSLGYADSTASYTDAAFGLNLTNSGNIWLMEAGQLPSANGNLGRYMSGDDFRVAVEGGVVRYYQNGRLLYQSTRVPVYPLWADVSLYHTGAAVLNVSLSGAWEPWDGVAWTRAMGVTVSRNTLMKTAATGWNAGASSIQSLASGSGRVEFTADAYSDRVVGLSLNDTTASYTDIAFGINLTNGHNVFSLESSVFVYLGTYTVGDRFRVAVESGVVRYYKNGVRLATSSQTASYPLRVDSSLYTTGAVCLNVSISGNWSP